MKTLDRIKQLRAELEDGAYPDSDAAQCARYELKSLMGRVAAVKQSALWEFVEWHVEMYCALPTIADFNARIDIFVEDMLG